MATLRERILKKMDYLPEPKLQEVLNFVEFITWRNTEQDEPLLSIAATLSGRTLSVQEIEDELYGDRKET